MVVTAEEQEGWYWCLVGRGARDTAKYCIMYRAALPTTKNYPVQNVDRAEVEKPWCRGTVL